jgi:hypothetical protein
MSEINTGGPAFPAAVTVSASGDVYHGFDGMTLRDWFAGQALAGICANPAWNDTFHKSVSAPSAEAAYSMADAMLAAREVAK